MFTSSNQFVVLNERKKRGGARNVRLPYFMSESAQNWHYSATTLPVTGVFTQS